MPRFETRAVPAEPDVAAPDGSQVRILLSLAGGSMAHFDLAPGLVSIPVAHRTVEELWYILSGRGEMWRRDAEGEDVVAIEAGVSLSIPLGTAFQFRSTGDVALTAVALTMPPWPGDDEAYVVDGKWEPKLTPPAPSPISGRGSRRKAEMSSLIELRDYIRDVPDFPEPGILFRDVTPLLQTPLAFEAAIERLCEYVRSREPDVIVGIESRGFIFGTPIAAALKLPFVPVRKPGKLPAARMSVEYSLEYGTGQLDIHQDALQRGQRVVIVDDLLATGGTALGAVKLVEMIRGRVVGFCFLIELAALPGRERLEDYDVFAAVVYE